MMEQKGHTTGETEKTVEQTFAELVDRNAEKLYAFCQTSCNSDRYGQDELYARIVCRLWRSYPFYLKEKDSLKESAWVYLTARRESRDYWRRQKRERGRTVLVDRLPEGSLTTEEDESLDLLYSIIDLLDGDDRFLIQLYIDGHSYKEMSEIAGIPQNSVGPTLSRIRKKMKTIKDKYEKR